MKVLDTTIRDGSYAIDFKFTRANVVNIVERLVKLGDEIEYIEIGHGQGIDASSPEHGVSLHTDIEYIDAAISKSENKKLGMFCIPGIAKLESLKAAKQHGLDFVRIGIPAQEAETAIEYIVEAKKLGLIVMINYMKTYAYTSEFIAEKTKMLLPYGVDYFYIVDSAGCMLPAEIDKYADAIRSCDKNIKLGFHGHNNLGMAVANSIRCVEDKFDLIDCSFQGLGRSLGNTSTEMFVMTMKRMYGEDILNMDIPKLLEYGYVSLREVVGNSMNISIQTPLDLICGYTGFHSSYIKQIYRCCCDYDVDPLRLIIAYCKVNNGSMDYDLLCKIAQNSPKDTESIDRHPYSFKDYFSAVYSS